MEFIGETFFGKITYEYKLKNGNLIWIKANEEELVEGVGKVRKIYFVILDDNKNEVGIKGEFVLKKGKLIFLNIVYENDANYAEFYVENEENPVKKFIRYDGKLYLKEDNEFYEVETNVENVGIDSAVTFLGKRDEFKYTKSTEKILEDRIILLEVLEIFKNFKNY